MLIIQKFSKSHGPISSKSSFDLTAILNKRKKDTLKKKRYKILGLKKKSKKQSKNPSRETKTRL